MQYILNDEFQALTESAGTIINISNVAAEISLSQTHGTGIILFPRQKLSFNKSVYAARAPGGLGTAVVAAIETGASSEGSESSSEGFTQSKEFSRRKMLMKHFPKRRQSMAALRKMMLTMFLDERKF